MVMWTIDKDFEATRKLRGWKEFNREAGKLNFYIDGFTKVGRIWEAKAFRLRSRTAPPYDMFPMESGTGKTQVDACIDAYRKAVAAGHMADTHLELLFADPVDSLDDMIGDAPQIEEEDLIG